MRDSDTESDSRLVMADKEPSATNVAPDANPIDPTTKLGQLKAQATQQYSLKNYSAAAEFYSEAAEVQDEINGEMSPLNADLLYQYGRCLYHVAVSNSDVLGGKVAGEEPKRKKRKVRADDDTNGVVDKDGEASKSAEQRTAEETVELLAEEASGVAEPKEKGRDDIANKPFFQITGDENWTDSEEEGEGDEGDAEQEEDDFAIAYEILDVARVLLMRNLQNAQEESGTGKQANDDPKVRQLRERLADTHDLQAEISLENERFHDAIKDTRDALALKLELFPQESSLIAEAHFKLSLALEFASVTSSSGTSGEEANGDEQKEMQVDDKMRKEAASEMEKAIASCKLRIIKEEALISTLPAAEQEAKKKSVADVKEMVQDMNNRLVDLRNPAVSLSGPTGPAGAPDGSDPLRGVLGAMLGESKVEQQTRIAEATATANDLTGLVKHKKKSRAQPATNGGEQVLSDTESKGKRKAEDPVEAAAVANGNGKRVKFDEQVDNVA